MQLQCKGGQAWPQHGRAMCLLHLLHPRSFTPCHLPYSDQEPALTHPTPRNQGLILYFCARFQREALLRCAERARQQHQEAAVQATIAARIQVGLQWCQVASTCVFANKLSKNQAGLRWCEVASSHVYNIHTAVIMAGRVGWAC